MRFAQTAGSPLRELIPAKRLMQMVTQQAGRYRDRVYGPLPTLVLFLEQVLSADHSCQDAVARGLSARLAGRQSACSLNTGPYCKARARLATALVQRLGREVGQAICAGQPRSWQWRGREVKLIDGTTVSMPDTQLNQACYPQNRQQKPGLGFPMGRLVAIISLSCGAVLEWALGPCEGEGTGETALLWPLAGQLSQGDVVLADRYFAGFFMLARLRQLGVDFLMRQHRARRTDFRCGDRLGAGDHLVSWVRPQRPPWMEEATYAQMPQHLSVREARVGGWILISSFTDAGEVSKQELLQLYRQRWQVELDLRSIKAVMQMGVLRCKSPQMVQKEIAVHLLAYNLVRALMAQAARQRGLLPRQLSFKGAMQLLNAFHDVLRHCGLARMAIMQAHLLGAIATIRVAHRPGRSEPRAVKRRQRHCLLTQKRSILRARLQTQQERRIAACLR